MAAEDIGELVPTKIPGYADSADIQAALRLYHYGSYSYDETNTNVANLVNPSIAYTLNDIQDQIDSLDLGISSTTFNAKGDVLTASADNTPAILSVGVNGKFLSANSATATGLEWTDLPSGSTSIPGILQLTDSVSSTSITTAATPNSVRSAFDLANAAIPKNIMTATGDIIYASSANTPVKLSAGTVGQVLTMSGGVPAWVDPSGGSGSTYADLFMMMGG